MNTIPLITDEIGKSILQHASPVTLPADTTVFRQGDACQNYILVQKGSVKVFTRAENGREVVLYRVGDGESCTLTTTCLFTNNKYPAEGITETEVQALVINRQDFNRGLEQSPDFRRMVFDSYSQRLTDIITLVEAISFGRIDTRLAKALLQHAVGEMTLHITHQDLAAELGSAREVISRQLKEFERRGWLILQRGSIELTNTRELENLARAPMM
ncbi:MAG TPA: Crp/Fnr family transcriptional regulator [Gammaproteobacteria bacterium]|nr:Crp/Fnr family transcriptional regulator [Gammaproteobacteria bacterium]